MSSKNLFVVLFILLFSQCGFGQSVRKKIALDNDWKFTFGHAKEPSKDLFYKIHNDFSKTKAKGINFSSIQYDDSTWLQIDLPHDWAVALPFSKEASCSHGYKTLGVDFPQTSIGWYRKKFMVEATDSDKRFEIQFDGIFRDAHIWINGMYLGNHQSGYMGVKYDITDFIDFKNENVITLRVDATQAEGWFYEGAGIYRHVWLNIFDNLYTPTEDVYIQTKSIGTNSEILTEIVVKNQYLTEKTFYLEYKILDRNKKVVTEATSDVFRIQPNGKLFLSKQLSINNSSLWDTDNPYLYTLVTKIVSNNETLEELHTRFGIRTFRYEPDGFYLNNKRVQIKGVCVHQDHAGIGTALLDEIQYYRINLLKEMGANAYRSAHNPPTPELLQACDSLGMLVMNETRLLNSGSEYLTQFENLIKRDRNHACIFMWCIGNEEELIQTTTTGKRIAQTLITKQYELDPSRTSTYGGNVGNKKEGVNEVIPVRGFNYNLYGLEDYKNQNPNQPIIGTEVGSTVSTRGIYIPENEINKIEHFNGVFVADTVHAYLLDQDYSYTNWASRAEQWLNQTFFDERFMGGFVWTGFDYRGEPTPFSFPNINSHFGVMDVCGFPKNIYYYYKSWWSDKDVLHIAPHWNIDAQPNQLVKVWVYSNADEIELFLNGKSLGKKMMPKLGHLIWEVKYQKGILKAVGLKNGRKIQSSVATTGKPTKIILTPHKKSLKVGNLDALVVNVCVVDKKGLEVPNANGLIHFNLLGDAQIIGVGNGDPSSHEKDTFGKNEIIQRKLFNGKCQVIIRSGKTKTPIQLQAFSQGLNNATITILQQ